MTGFNYSIPWGMVFKKYYCSKCGAKLEKEKTYRVVSNNDKDYYQYHSASNLLRGDHAVHSYRLKCPACEARISYIEQCIIERIQKKLNHKILSSTEIKDNYNEEQLNNSKRVFRKSILYAIIINILFAPVFYFAFTAQDLIGLGVTIAFYIISTIVGIISTIRDFKGTNKFRHNQTYSHEKESQLNILQAYSSHNKKYIDTADSCYCFHCKSSFKATDIVSYTDNGQTALCPKCHVDTIIPDSINHEVNESIIEEMNKYWF